MDSEVHTSIQPTLSLSGSFIPLCLPHPCPSSHPPFLIAPRRKLVRPVTTPDFMFGQLVAPPPPASVKVCSDAEDVLRCFHETGSPATSELSPITVVRLYIHIYIYTYIHIYIYTLKGILMSLICPFVLNLPPEVAAYVALT